MISRIIIHKGRTACGTMAIAMLLTVAMSGCIADRYEDPGIDESRIITFTPAVSNAKPGTRAADGHPIKNGGNIPQGKSFGVYAYSRISSTSTPVSYNAELPNNTEVTHNGTAFTYSPVAKWPTGTEAQLAFFGYYPWQDPDATPTPLVDPVIEVTPRSSSAMWIVYTTPQNPAKHIDLMYAYADFTTGYESVDMEFHHALTRVNFKAKVEDYTQPLQITSITINNVRPQGMLNIVGGSSPTWANSVSGSNTAPIDMMLDRDNGLVQNHTLTSALSWVSVPGSTTETAGDMLVIPQYVEDMEVVVTATIGTDPTPETFTFSLAGTPDWKMNQIVTYEITIAGNGMRITPHIQSNWENNNIEVIQDGQWWMYVDEDEFEFDVNAGAKALNIKTNYNPSTSQGSPPGLFVEAVADPTKITYDPELTFSGSPWLTVNTGSVGSDGSLSRELTISTTANGGRMVRKASFTVTAGNMNKVIHVTQSPYVITKAEVSYPYNLPLAANNTNYVAFNLWGTFPVNTVWVRLRYSNSSDYSSQRIPGAGTGDGSPVSHTLYTTSNPSWHARNVFCEYFDPHAGTEGQWVTIDTQEQKGYEVTATATSWTQPTQGKSFVTISGYRPNNLNVRAIVEGTTIPLSIASVNSTPSPLTTELTIPATTVDRTIIIQYLRDGVWTEITTFTQSTSTSIAPRFARSNVVWDAANNRLTFATTEAENSTVAPANAQGVFFKWGSLVAVSPTGTSAAYNANQILFQPTAATYSTWSDIPYINETTGKFSTHGTDEDDFDGYNGGTNTGGPGYDDSANKGDICRYITAQGWVPSGERWRLPKQSELDALMGEITSVSNNGGFRNDGTSPNTSSNVNGYWEVPSGRWLGKGAATAGASRGTEQVPGGSSVYFPTGGYRYYSNGTTNNARGRVRPTIPRTRTACTSIRAMRSGTTTTATTGSPCVVSENKFDLFDSFVSLVCGHLKPTDSFTGEAGRNSLFFDDITI